MDTARLGSLKHGRKIGMDGQVMLARCVQRPKFLMPAYGLQGVPKSRGGSAIIDEEASAAL
jgi:hypothetical protein